MSHGKSMEAPKEPLNQKLQALNCTQQAIESVAKWCIFYHTDAHSVVTIWQDHFTRAPNLEKRMTLMYLANHILQEGRKKGKEFTDEFLRALPRCLKLVQRSGDDKSRKSAERLLKIWEERRVFSSSAVKTLQEHLAGKADPAAAATAATAPPAAPTATPAPPHVAAGGTEAADKLKLQVGCLLTPCE